MHLSLFKYTAKLGNVSVGLECIYYIFKPEKIVGFVWHGQDLHYDTTSWESQY